MLDSVFDITQSALRATVIYCRWSQHDDTRRAEKFLVGRLTTISCVELANCESEAEDPVEVKIEVEV